MIGNRLVPAQIAAAENLPGLLDGAGVRIADAVRLHRVEVMRRVEVRDENAVRRVAKFARLGRIAHLDQEFDTTLVGLGRVPRHQPVAERIDEHLQRFVAGRQRPAVPGGDQRKWLVIFVEVNAGGVETDVIADDERPVAERHVFQLLERIDRG